MLVLRLRAACFECCGGPDSESTLTTPHRDVPFTKIDQEGKKIVTKVEKNKSGEKKEHHTHTTPLHITQRERINRHRSSSSHSTHPSPRRACQSFAWPSRQRWKRRSRRFPRPFSPPSTSATTASLSPRPQSLSRRSYPDIPGPAAASASSCDGPGEFFAGNMGCSSWTWRMIRPTTGTPGDTRT